MKVSRNRKRVRGAKDWLRIIHFRKKFMLTHNGGMSESAKEHQNLLERRDGGKVF